MTAGDIELPSGMQWIAYATGTEWPQGSEHGMFDLADVWSAASTQTQGLVAEVQQAINDILDAYPQGDANTSLSSALGVLTDSSNNGSVPYIATSMEDLAESCNNLGCVIQEYKIQIIAGLVMLLIDIALAWIFPPTAPAVEAAEIASWQVWAGLMKVILREAVMAAITQGVVQGAIDAAIQLYQWLGEHRRNGMNLSELGMSALGGALGGAFGVVGAQVAGKAFDYAMDGALEGAIGEGFDSAVTSVVSGINKGVQALTGTEEKFSGETAAATARSTVGNILEGGAAGIAGAAGGGLAPLAFGQGYSLTGVGLAAGVGGALGAGIRGIRTVQNEDGGAHAGESVPEAGVAPETGS